jgi:hypothetical protein
MEKICVQKFPILKALYFEKPANIVSVCVAL